MAQSMGSFEKVLRLGEGRRLKRLAEQAAYVGTLEPEFEALSDEQLAGKTAEFKERLEKRRVARGAALRGLRGRSERRSSARSGSASSTSS